MKRQGLSAVLVVAALLLAVNVVFATEGDQWARTVTTEAVADFTIQHSPDLITSGSARISQTRRWSGFTGMAVIEELRFQAVLAVCDAEACRKVWTVEAYERFDPPAPFILDGVDAANVLAGLSARVEVYDFDDADFDGNFDEPVGVFTAPIQLELGWIADGGADSSVSCEWDGGEAYINRYTNQKASVEGLVNGYILTESYGKIFQHDHTQTLNPKSDDCLEERGEHATLLLGNNALF